MPTYPTAQLKLHESRLLAAFGVFPRLTIAQVTRLLYSPASEEFVSRVLARLETQGFLLHGYKEGTKSPVHHYVYALDERGRFTLRREGYVFPETWKRGRQLLFGSNFMQHSLEISDILITAILAGHDPRIGVGAVIHDEFMGARVTGKLTVKPDAFVPMTAAGADVSFAVELDRAGTEGEQAWKGKVRGYFAANAQPYCTVFHTAYLAVAVVVNPIAPERLIVRRGGKDKTPEERARENAEHAWSRMTQLATWTAEEVRHLGYDDDAAKVFSFTTARATGRVGADAVAFFTQRHWYRPYEAEPRSLFAW